ncbi:MAG TPA: HEAT repeat domain-containing protein [Deltaproteobacteria bacterium]|nr:HEAT repeat domain-containing protein [Deltaproteobacteria bacterium]
MIGRPLFAPRRARRAPRATRREGRSFFASRVCLMACLVVALPAIATQKVIGDEPPDANAAVMPLLRQYATGDLPDRMVALMAMRELGPVAWPAVPVLVEALEDPVMGIRKAAAGALGGIGPAAASAVPALTAALSDPHRFVRSWAAMALDEIGPMARSATGALLRMLEGDRENRRGRAWCASALAKVEADPDLAVPALLRALREDPSEEVRSVAVLSLEHYGREAGCRFAIRGLVDALDDPHWKVRGNAACALPEMGAEASRIASDLARALHDEAPYVRGCAVRALAEVDPGSAATIRAIEGLLDDPDEDVRREAARALGRKDPGATFSGDGSDSLVRPSRAPGRHRG